MINSIEIKNFQSHKNTRLELDPGVNAIVGPSDCGKSVVFRALNWLINNRPSGNDFHSWWGGEPKVSVLLDNAETIIRTKKKTENIYKLGPQIFKAFGSNVPDEISKALNTSDINFQFQLDDPFLFGQTPGNIARKLNEVVDLAIIDKALFAINQRYRKESGDLADSQAREENLSKEFDDYKWLPIAEGCLAKLEYQSNQLDYSKLNKETLSGFIDDLKASESRYKEAQKGPARFEKKVNDLIKLDNKIEQDVVGFNKISDLLADIKGSETQIHNIKILLEAEPDINKAIKIENQIANNDSQRIILELYLQKINELKETISITKRIMSESIDKFKELMPDECPLCGQEVL